MNEYFNPSWSKDRRRELRRNCTVEEAMLWKFLKEKQLGGVKFRRQCGIGPYITDFCCPQAKLIVEIDGGIHNETKEYDAERDAYLEGLGYRVLRFRSSEIREQIQTVLESIRSSLIPSPF